MGMTGTNGLNGQMSSARCAVDVVAHGEVCSDSYGVGCAGLQQRRDRVIQCSLATREYGHTRAFTRQTQRGSPAHSPRAPTDDRCGLMQSKIRTRHFGRAPDAVRTEQRRVLARSRRGPWTA